MFRFSFQFRCEPVPELRHGLDVTRLFQRVPERLPEPSDRGIQSVFEIDECVVGPETPTEFVTRDSGSRFLQQGCEYLERLCLELNSHTVFTKHAALHVEL